MESKVPGSTSRISLYSKYRNLQKVDVLLQERTRGFLLRTRRNGTKLAAELSEHASRPIYFHCDIIRASGSPLSR